MRWFQMMEKKRVFAWGAILLMELSPIVTFPPARWYVMAGLGSSEAMLDLALEYYMLNFNERKVRAPHGY